MFGFYYFIILFILFIIILSIGLISDKKHEKIYQQQRELEIEKEELEIKKREETDVVFRYRDIPDELLADHYIHAEYENDTNYMEDMKKVMIGRSKKASFEEAFEYYYKLYDEWRFTTNYGFY